VDNFHVWNRKLVMFPHLSSSTCFRLLTIFQSLISLEIWKEETNGEDLVQGGRITLKCYLNKWAIGVWAERLQNGPSDGLLTTSAIISYSRTPLVDLKGFWRWCMLYRTIGLILDSIHRLIFCLPHTRRWIGSKIGPIVLYKKSPVLSTWFSL
jgi:hypothetical protein